MNEIYLILSVALFLMILILFRFMWNKYILKLIPYPEVEKKHSGFTSKESGQ